MSDFILPEVNASALKTSREYVCWIDIMGTKNIMSESLQKATNFILKFHSCVIRSIKEDSEKIHYYPLMDGIFITTSQLLIMQKAVNSIFSNAANIFLHERQNIHRFIIKGSLAYGPIYHGNIINDSVCHEIASNDDYKKTILLGMPMIQAFTTEKAAPPFGIYIHESARQYQHLQGRYYKWRNSTIDTDKLQAKIESYFNWCDKYSEYLELDPQKIARYKKLTNEYFSKRDSEDEESQTKIDPSLSEEQNPSNV